MGSGKWRWKRQVALIGIVALSGALKALAAEEPMTTSWTDRIKILGDFRLRQEMIQEEGQEDRHRSRMRVRLGTQMNLEDNLTGHFRLATAQADDNITSTNQTFGGGANRKDIGVDLAYVDYRPFTEARLWAGKTPNPFFTAGKSDIIFDTDWTPEGLGVKSQLEMDSLFLGTNLGTYWLDERTIKDTEASSDAMLYAVQLVGGFKSSDTILTLGVAYYAFSNLKDQRILGGSSTFIKNNSTVDLDGDGKGDLYTNEYTPLNVGLEFELLELLPFSTAIYGDWVRNTAGSGDSAHYIGLRLGKLKDGGTWQFDYNFRKIEKDAVVGAINDSDAFGGGTDGESHKFYAGYQITNSTGTSLTYYLSEKGLSKPKDYQRAQLDVVFVF